MDEFENLESLLADCTWYNPAWRGVIHKWYKQVRFRSPNLAMEAPLYCVQLKSSISRPSLCIEQVSKVYRMCPVTLENTIFFLDSYVASTLDDEDHTLSDFQV
jgi:hypothetical protein